MLRYVFLLIVCTAGSDNQQDFTGEKIVDLFGDCGVSAHNASAIVKAINDVVECLSVLSLHGGLPKGKGLTKMSELIELLFMDNHQIIQVRIALISNKTLKGQRLQR